MRLKNVDNIPKQTAQSVIPDDPEAEHLPLHHRRRQARAAVAERRASVPAHDVEEADRDRDGRSAPRPGEVRGSGLRDAARLRAAYRVTRYKLRMNVVLGVGGGIAAYKAAELARALMERGFTVQVVMTAAAEEFIRPLTFAALTGRKVITDLFGSGSSEETLSSAIEHIRVAQENQMLVVAPATADLLAKFAHGLADDFLTTLIWPSPAPVVLAPAMNTNMWQHPATQANMRDAARARAHDRRAGRGIAGLRHGRPGRLAEPERDRRSRRCDAAHPRSATWKAKRS